LLFPGEHYILAQRAEEAMSFQEVQLREGIGPVINQAQFIRAVADNMKQRLITTVSNRAQATVVATRQEMYEKLVSQMAVLNPRNWVHENPRFGENEVKSLCKTFHHNNQEIHLGFVEYKSSGGRSISNKFNKLLVAVDTLPPSNADCERGFSAMNNIINDRSLITANNAANLPFISTVGPPSQAWDPDPYVKTWLGKGRRAAHSTSGMACQKPKEDNYYEPL